MRWSTAAISSDFLRLVKRLKDKKIFESPKFKGGKKFITMYDVTDPEDENAHYVYTERLGRDSVAFLLYDRDHPEEPFITLSQFHSPCRKFVEGAFTGSLDKPDLNPTEIVVEEVSEEAGYDVDDDRVHLVAFLPVAGNTNEQVHLALVDITGLDRRQIDPENIFEQNTRIQRRNYSEITQKCEWKAIVIATLYDQYVSGHLFNPDA
jgi:8-oxo-dGTP pyrophosphatase MutT (NUDIX family)